MKSPIPDKVAKVRRDITTYLFHFVNRDGRPADTLRAILRSGHIRGGIYPPCTDPTVCFTEAPLGEIVRQDGILDAHSYKRLSLWGIGFKKKFIFDSGGLPAVYQPRRDLGELVPGARWRHVDFDLATGIDYTWQREWRLRTAELNFESEDAILVVPSVKEFVRELWYVSYDAELEDGELTYHGGTYKKWDFIPLEHTLIATDSDIEVCRGDDFRDIIQEEDYQQMDFDGP